jgi:hypothetical protein
LATLVRVCVCVCIWCWACYVVRLRYDVVRDGVL